MSERKVKALPDQSNLLADLQEWTAKINAMPPAPSGIRAHHSVPYGRLFRQWDTKGRLWVWANAGMIQDLPRQPYEAKGSRVHSLDGPAFGIPIYSEAHHGG